MANYQALNVQSARNSGPITVAVSRMHKVCQFDLRLEDKHGPQLQTPWVVETPGQAKAGAVDLGLEVITGLVIKCVKQVRSQLDVITVTAAKVEVLRIIQIYLMVRL